MAKIELEQIDFQGVGNVDIRIDGTTDIDTPGGGANDVEWVRMIREDVNSTAPWDSSQSAPAAYIKGNALSMELKFSAQPPTVSQIKFKAMNSGAYGEIAEKTVQINNGVGMVTVSTAGTPPSTVNVNDVTFEWELESIILNGDTVSCQSSFRDDTTHRVYTLKAAPSAPMAEPWATVLELSCGIAKSKTTDLEIVEEMTRGIHHSRWMGFAATSRFVNPTAKLIYNPSVVRSNIVGAGAQPFASQVFDLNNFMSFLDQGTNVQQCNDNSNLLSAVLLRSLGIPMDPKWFGHAGYPFVSLPLTKPYYPAGLTTTVQFAFRFHQVGFFSGKVYDPSTRPTLAGDPFMNQTFAAYLAAAFTAVPPTLNYAVTTITIGSVSSAPPTISSTAPAGIAVGSMANVTITGTNFTAGTWLSLFEVGTDTPAANVTLTNANIVSTSSITIDVTVAAGATPRMVEFVVSRSNVPVGEFRHTFEIQP